MPQELLCNSTGEVVHSPIIEVARTPFDDLMIQNPDAAYWPNYKIPYFRIIWDRRADGMIVFETVRD